MCWRLIALILAAFISLPVKSADLLDWLRDYLAKTKPVDLLTPAEKSQPTKLTVQGEVERLFATSACELPQTLRDQFSRAGQQTFLPDELKTGLETQRLGSAVIQKIDGVGIRGVLHTLTLAEKDNPTNIRLVSASSYTSLDPSLLIDPNTSDLVFTMDCTGYLTAALSVAANIPAAQVQSSAKLARNSSRSILIARARVFSPVAIAINPALAPAGYPIDPATRLDLLYAAANEVAQAARTLRDDVIIVSWRQQDILWMSNRGSSSLQGSGSFSASTSAGLGVVSLQGAVDAGMRASREVRFAAFDTYILGEATMRPVVKSYGELRDDLRQLVFSLRPYARDENKDSAGQRTIRYFYKTLPRSICQLSWDLEKTSAAEPTIGAASSAWEASTGICTINLFPSASPFPSGKATLIAASGLPANDRHYFRMSLELP